MKKLILSLFLSPIFIVNAQQVDLDEDFLDSLPTDIREDVISKSEANKENQGDNYRASTYSSKLKQDEDLISLKLRLETDLAELNKRLESDKRLAINNELELYGSKFFSTFQTSYMPVNEPNPGSSYILDIGDILNIQLTGQSVKFSEYPIKGDGSIYIEGVGKIVLAGLSLNDGSELIKAQVDNAFIGRESFISLSKLRDVNVLITGNAKNPGIYTLAGNSNILQAINIAGGINEYGSFRKINLIRNNKVIETLDVYDLLLDGNYNIKERLRSGDVVFIEPRKNVVTIDGAVKRPAKYELLDEQNLGDAIKYSNGFNQTADILNISLERILDGSLKTIPVVNASQFNNIKPIDGDTIYIREYPFRTATISGAVLKPGRYIMGAGESVNDLLEKAGGYTDEAYVRGAVFENEDAKEINKKAKDLLYKEFLASIIELSQQNVNGSFDLAPIVSLTKEINNSKPNGRIVVDLENEDYSKTLSIKEGDHLIIPEKTNNVYVYGEVSSEGSVMHTSDKDIDFYIDKSGGLKKFADRGSIYILHPNGETERYSRSRNIFESQPRSDLKISPGSVIFVPRQLDNTAARTIAAQAYVTILGNLGLALASLNSIAD